MDPELRAIEERMSELVRTRRDALEAAENLTKGVWGILAGWRGTREQRVEDAVHTARFCQMELDRLREVHERRIAELDPVKAEELAQNEERLLLMERAATVRKRGGARAKVLDQLEHERRSRMDFVDSLEHALFVGERALAAIDEYARRLEAKSARLEADSLTARIGLLASVKTAAAEARESLTNFIERVGIADESMIRIGEEGATGQQELLHCRRNRTDIQALMAKMQFDLEMARDAVRPIEAAYRNFLMAATTNASPPREAGPTYE